MVRFGIRLICTFFLDDEAMVELAIALSLQEQGEGVDLANLQQGLQQLANLGPGLQGFPALQGLAGMLGGAVGGLPAEEVAPEPDLAPQQVRETFKISPLNGAQLEPKKTEKTFSPKLPDKTARLLS